MRTQVQIQTAAALLPFCKAQTAQARSGAGAAQPDSNLSSRALALLKLFRDGNYPEETIEALRAVGIIQGWNMGPEINRAWAEDEHGRDDEESGFGSYPVGSVVVVTGGEAVSRAKRVLGKAYIVVGHDGERPVPLGLRGQSEERRTSLNLSDIRPATDAELTAAVNSLNDAQTKMIVCEPVGR